MAKRQCVVCRTVFETDGLEMWCSDECHETIQDRAREAIELEMELRKSNSLGSERVGTFGKSEAERAREAMSMVGNDRIELFTRTDAEHNDRLYNTALAILTAAGDVSIAEHARTMLRLARECIEELEASFDVRVPNFRPSDVLPEGDDPSEEET